jgi:integrase/recombinase XerD
VARGFARHLQAFDPAAEVPPAGLAGPGPRRPAPYLYSDEDIAALMAAAAQLKPALRAATYQTLVGLLVVTGHEDRRGHQPGPRRHRLRRRRADGLVLQVRQEPGTAAAPHRGRAEDYATVRDKLCPKPEAASFLLSAAGTQLVYVTVQQVFVACSTRPA